MRSLIVIPFLILTSQAWGSDDHPKEVTVSGAKFVDLPQGCYGRKFPCALKFTSGGKTKVQSLLLAVSKGTSVLLREKEMELLAGRIWSDEFEDTKIRHGMIEVVLTGDILVEKDEDQLEITNLNGVAEVIGGRKTTEPIPSGFQNWYRGLGQKGEFAQGVLEPVRPDDFLPTWVVLSGLSGAEAQERAATYAKNRRVAVEESAKLYQDILQMRRLASEEKERQAALASARAAQERQHFKQMMRNRLFRPD